MKDLIHHAITKESLDYMHLKKEDFFSDIEMFDDWRDDKRDGLYRHFYSPIIRKNRYLEKYNALEMFRFYHFQTLNYFKNYKDFDFIQNVSSSTEKALRYLQDMCCPYHVYIPDFEEVKKINKQHLIFDQYLEKNNLTIVDTIKKSNAEDFDEIRGIMEDSKNLDDAFDYVAIESLTNFNLIYKDFDQKIKDTMILSCCLMLESSIGYLSRIANLIKGVID
jgi:hypothetical protein